MQTIQTPTMREISRNVGQIVQSLGGFRRRFSTHSQSNAWSGSLNILTDVFQVLSFCCSMLYYQFFLLLLIYYFDLIFILILTHVYTHHTFGKCNKCSLSLSYLDQSNEWSFSMKTRDWRTFEVEQGFCSVFLPSFRRGSLSIYIWITEHVLK